MLDQHDRPRRGPASRTATAVTLIALMAMGMTAVGLATKDVASRDIAGGPERVSFPREDSVGACLHVAYPRPTTPWPGIEAFERVVATQDHLFPAPGIVTTTPGPMGEDTIVALWPNGASSSDGAATERSREAAACAPAQRGWSLRITRALLSDGADRLLEQADFGEDWTARIRVAFHPRQNRVRTKLIFSGPFGVAGSCWIDETLVIDLETGLPDVVSESRNDAGLAGLVACRRFEDELSEGGAGAQALALLPTSLTEAGADPILTLAHIDVTKEMVVLSGVTG